MDSARREHFARVAAAMQQGHEDGHAESLVPQRCECGRRPLYCACGDLGEVYGGPDAPGEVR